MSFLHHLDDEFFKIQDFVSVLADSLPRLELSYNLDTDTLIRLLIEQNKQYGKKIISLYESIDNIYKNFSAFTDQDGPTSPDFTSRLHTKIQDYEELIKRLTDENEEFAKQIKSLSNQIGDIHSHTLSQTASTQSRFTTGKSSVKGGSQNKRYSNNDVSRELEALFSGSDYSKACELLSSLDYTKPNNVSFEKYSTWLEILNRVKDSQLSDALNKLKVLVAFSDKSEDETLRVTSPTTTFEKIQYLLDDKIPKIILKNEYELQQERDEKENIRPGTFKPRNSISDQNQEHLLMKIEYLNSQLSKANQDINNKEVELRTLKERARDNTYNSRESQAGSVDREKENLVKSLEAEVRMRTNIEQQLQDAHGELIELRDRLESLEKDLQESHQGNTENNELINRLIRENSKLREQCEFSEKLEDIEKYKDMIIEKEAKIRALSEELASARVQQRSPEQPRERSLERGRKFINDTSPETSRSNRELRTTLFIENQLHKQASTLSSINLIVSQINSNLPSHIDAPFSPGKTRLSLRSEGSEDNSTTQQQGPQSTSEINKLLKTNHSTLQGLLNNLSSFKESFFKVLGTRKFEERDSSETYQSLVQKIIFAEDSFLQNISVCFQSLSQLTSLLQNLPSDANPASFLPQTLTNLQNLHVNLNKTLEEFPDFSTERLQTKDKGSVNRSTFEHNATPNHKASGSISITQTPGHSRNNFREKLIRDQGELTSKLRQSLAVIQKNHREDIFLKLNNEIEKNQDLQEKLDAKDHLLHRLNLTLNECLDRAAHSLTELIKLADSTEAQSLLSSVINQIAHLKDRFFELGNDSVKASSVVLGDLKHEFDKQKQLWNKRITEIQTGNDDTIFKLVKEIEGERKAHEETLKKYHELQHNRQYENELDQQLKTLQRDLDEKQEKIADLKRELRKAQQESKDAEFLKEEIGNLKSRLNERTEELRRREEMINELRGELTDLRKDVDDLSRSRNAHESELERQNRALRDENKVLVEFKKSSQESLVKSSEHMDQIRNNFAKELATVREENKELGYSLHQAKRDLEKKVHTISELNNMLDSLQVMSNKQIETLKQKDEKFCELQMKFTETDRIKRNLDSRVEELTHKNEKYNDLLSAEKKDIAGLKGEVQQLINLHDELRKDLETAQRKNEELSNENRLLNSNFDKINTEKQAIEERIYKMNELIQINKGDYKGLKESLEIKNQELAAKEKELQQINELLRKERQSDREKELVSHLRQEITVKTNDINNLRNELQNYVHGNEKLNIELETLKASNKCTSDQIKEMDRLNNINKALSLELESIRKNMKHREEMNTMEKEAYDRELQILQKKLNDLQKILEEKEQRLKSSSKGLFSGTDSTKSQVESKDLEIKRLTQIVKNLTDNLKDTQESKFKLKKPK